MEKSASIENLAKALSKAQAAMGGAQKGSANPFFKSKYADLGSVMQAVKEPFADNGLSFVQFPIEKEGRIGIETILMHESGEYLSNSFTVQLGKQDAQAAGSAITYCRRYGLQAVAGIPSVDDDGNAASKAAVRPDSKPVSAGVCTIVNQLKAKKPAAWDWVHANWGGIIADNWDELPADALVKLNELIQIQEKPLK